MNTLKEERKAIARDIHIKYLAKAKTAKIDGSELTVLPYGYLSQAVEEALLSHEEKVMEEEKVFVFQPQWIDEEPAWLCILTKGNEVLAEKVYKKSELGNAYWKETGNYASSVITVGETNIGAKRLLKELTLPIIDENV